MTEKDAASILSYFRVKDDGEISQDTWYSTIKRDTEEALGMAIKALEQEPKIGYWIHHKETPDCAEHWECSRCHRTTMTNPFIVDGNDYNAMFYCPKCGAKMPECEVE